MICKFKLFRVLLLMIFISFTVNSSSQNWSLEWADEFDSAYIDTTKWSFQIGNGGPSLPGWGNNELEYYTDRPENVRIEDSILIIEARKEFYMGFQYTSARIRTSEKVDFQFGKMIARMKLPEGQGIWPAFWMLPAKSNFTWPGDGEIDIMELVGHEPNISHGTLHYGQPWPNNQYKGCSYTLPSGNFSDDFHDFSIVWELNSIKWYIDEILFCTLTPNDIQPHSWPFNNHPFYLLLNLAVGGNWPGNPDGTTIFPQTIKVDYIRFYKDISTSSNNEVPQKENFSIKVSQNLLAQSLTIESTKEIEKVSIINMHGKTVWEDSQNTTRHHISTSGLGHGIYLIKAVHDGINSIQKIVL